MYCGQGPKKVEAKSTTLPSLRVHVCAIVEQTGRGAGRWVVRQGRKGGREDHPTVGAVDGV